MVDISAMDESSLENLLSEGRRPSRDHRLQPLGWHDSLAEEVKLGVVLKPLVPKTEKSFFASLLPQLGQTNSICSLLIRTSFSNFSPQS